MSVKSSDLQEATKATLGQGHIVLAGLTLRQGQVEPPAQGQGHIIPPAQGQGHTVPPAQGQGHIVPPALEQDHTALAVLRQDHIVLPALGQYITISQMKNLFFPFIKLSDTLSNLWPQLILPVPEIVKVVKTVLVLVHSGKKKRCLKKPNVQVPKVLQPVIANLHMSMLLAQSTVGRVGVAKRQCPNDLQVVKDQSKIVNTPLAHSSKTKRLLKKPNAQVPKGLRAVMAHLTVGRVNPAKQQLNDLQGLKVFQAGVQEVDVFPQAKNQMSHAQGMEITTL